MLRSETPPPWAGAGAAYAIKDVLDLIRDHQTSLIFHNTRAQAEIFFHNLWLANEEGLPIGIHHGSLDRVQREKVEAAMVANQLRAVVCTGSLDLGIDWGNVDLVIQIGAPKNAKRLVQRIGRANHRYNAPSKAVIVPANRFEVIECQAALDALNDNDLDGDSMRRGALDVLCQHILICACQAPFDPDALFEQILTTDLYKSLTRAVFDKCLDFCASGGYALRAYDEWHRLIKRPEGTFALRDPRAAAKIRMNIGTIQDTDTLKVRLKKTRGGKPLGEVEESFAATLRQGETFLIGGQIVRFEGLRDMVVEVTRRADKTPRVAVFSGTKFATSLQLSHRVMQILSEENWQSLPDYVQDWLALQKHFSHLPHPDRLLIESFPRREMEHTVIYGFAGRNAQQTLGLLVTKRMEDMGLDPLGFVATDYATMIWGLEQIQNPEQLLNAANLRDDLQNWLTQNAVMKRTFREVAHISGLIQRNGAGQRKSGRQVTFSSDILFDTLIKYDPDHLLLDITRQEAMSGLIDFARLEHMLTRIQNRIDLIRLSHVSPLAAPLLLEVGRVPIKGEAEEKLMARETETLMREAGLA
jgi:ATP-dependent Lhr-like helicase